MALMAQDKKVRRGRLTFILLQAVGRAVIAPDIEPALVRDFLQARLADKIGELGRKGASRFSDRSCAGVE